MKLLKSIFPYLLVIILTLLWVRECQREPETKTITRTVTVTVPEIRHTFDTVYRPIPAVIRETDTIVLKEFLSASDSLRIALYINATKEREYNQQFKDSTQEINVFSKVRGEMLSQNVDYRIFERTISHTDTITIPKNRSLYLVPKLGTDFNNTFKGSIGLVLIDKKDNYFSVDFDTDRVFLFGYGLRW